MNSHSTSMEESRFAASPTFFLMLGFILLGTLLSVAAMENLHARPGTPSYSSAALFDEANALAREGKTASAILSYEKAKLLAPQDPRIRANLQWMREHAGLSSDGEENGLSSAVSWVSPDTLAWLGFLGLLSIGGGMLSFFYFPQRGYLLGGLIFAGTVLMALSGSSGVLAWQKSHQDIVMTPNAPARISPTTNGEISFTLPPGELITVEGQYHDFVLVKNGKGYTGWVRKNDLAPIDQSTP